MDKFKKGEMVQNGTSPRVYEVTQHETNDGRLHVKRGDRTYVFDTKMQDISAWHGIGSADA